MAELYQLGTAGGARSARFRAYAGRAALEWGLAGYNPMAGPHALDAVRHLMACSAEPIAGDAAQAVVEHCRFAGDVTLAIVVASPGMWTHRVATEVRHRTARAAALVEHRGPPEALQRAAALPSGLAGAW